MPLTESRPFTFDRVVRLGITAALIYALVFLMGYLSEVLIPFALALILAYLMNPLVVLLQRLIPNRAVSVILSLILVLLGLALLAWLVVPLIGAEVGRMSRILSDLVTNSKLAQAAAERLPEDLWLALKDLAARPEIKEWFASGDVWALAAKAAQEILPGVWGLVAGAVNLVLGIFGLAVVGLYTVFLLMDFQRVRRTWSDLLPPTWREPVLEFTEEAGDALGRYFRGQALVATLVGVLFALGFGIIGLPLGILLGLFIGLLNMVPYLQIIGLLPAFCLALIQALETGGNFWLALGLVGGVFVVVQAIQDTILTPRIMGKATGFSPAVILLSLSIWGKLLGFLGLVIALPLTYILLAYYRRLVLAKAVKAQGRAEGADRAIPGPGSSGSEEPPGG